jgi:gluconate 2-dehydrogenase gamma chain
MASSRRTITRRDYLAVSLAASAPVAAAQRHAREALANSGAATFQVLTPADARTIEALSAQIIPSDGGPGAREAGAVYFIDRALATFDSGRRQDYREGLALVRRTLATLFPAASEVASLTADQQIALLRAIEKSDFFELLRTHAVLGFLGSPAYGGNRGGAGWRHIGFEHRMAFEPPFGYYDARKDEA